MGFSEEEQSKNERMPDGVSSARYPLVKGERIIRSVPNTRLNGSLPVLQRLHIPIVCVSFMLILMEPTSKHKENLLKKRSEHKSETHEEIENCINQIKISYHIILWLDDLLHVQQY